MKHAGREVLSGNDPKGDLAILYFQKEEDHEKNHAGYGISLFDDFDTNCSDFVNVVTHAKIWHGEVMEGGFIFDEL